MEFHEKLLMLRRKKGVTQQEAADALGISRPTYGGYESGKRHPQQNGMYQRLADYFGVAIDELFPAKEADAPETPPAAAATSRASSPASSPADSSATRTRKPSCARSSVPTGSRTRMKNRRSNL